MRGLILSIMFACLGCVGCATTVFKSDFVAREGAFKWDDLQRPTILAPIVSARACRHYILFLGGWTEGELQDAFDGTLAGQPNALGLAKMRVDDEILFTLFYNRRCKEVSGYPVLPK